MMQWEKPCPRCGHQKKDIESPDGCLGMLPGVDNACCGHGVRPGYIRFTSGVIVRNFQVTQDARYNHHPLRRHRLLNYESYRQLLTCARCNTPFQRNVTPESGPIKCPQCHGYLDLKWSQVEGGIPPEIIQVDVHPLKGELALVALTPSLDELNNRDLNKSIPLWKTRCVTPVRYLEEPLVYGSNVFLSPKGVISYVQSYIAEASIEEAFRVQKLLDLFIIDNGAAMLERFRQYEVITSVSDEQ